MIDESDADLVLLAFGGSLFGTIVAVMLAIVLYLMASNNADECARRECSTGHVGKLLDHECVCVEVAKERR